MTSPPEPLQRVEVDGTPVFLPSRLANLRPHQEDAVAQINRRLDYHKVVFLDAPTGAGKTLIGEVVRQVRSGNALYVCTTLPLQRQFLHDFPYAKVIMGRANYPTLDDPEAFKLPGSRQITAAHCTKRSTPGDEFPVCGECEDSTPDFNFEGTNNFRHCYYCHPWQECPYEVAKANALNAQIAVANTAYFLGEANHVGRFGVRVFKDGRIEYPFKLVVIDEADTLESVIMGQTELNLTKPLLKSLNLPLPSKITVPSSWLEWCEIARAKLTDELNTLFPQITQSHFAAPSRELTERIDKLGSYLLKITQVHSQISANPDSWVYDGHEKGHVVLKPVEISGLAQHLLWRHSESFLIMSATVISPDQMAQDLGLQPHEWDVVRVESDFPAERRPLYVQPIVSMTHSTKDESWPIMAEAVVDILRQHTQERVLVHTVSYAWNSYLESHLRTMSDLNSRVLTYASARDRERVLETYRRQIGAILLAPSFDRGVDLPDEDCRVIIITKVPFPNLGDRQVSKRFYGTPGGKSWFATLTVRALVQMTGRGMRHRDDYCKTYILDSQFKTNIWRNGLTRHRIPNWWSKALNWAPPTR